jgi:hypothetical protein
MSKAEIFCPKCKWKPRPGSRWICGPRLGGCGHVWNTFDTHGICPKCNWHWIITACLWCKQFSPHEEWYHEPGGDSEAREEEERVSEEG